MTNQLQKLEKLYVKKIQDFSKKCFGDMQFVHVILTRKKKNIIMFPVLERKVGDHCSQ